jgi:hypothetical protein
MKINLKEIVCEGVQWIQLAQDVPVESPYKLHK